MRHRDKNIESTRSRKNKAYLLLLVLSGLCFSSLLSFYGGYKLYSIKTKRFNAEKTHNYQKNREEFELKLKTTDKIVFVGDSLMAGAPWSEIFPDESVAVRAYDGIDTTKTLSVVQSIVEQKPSAVILMAGINDVFTHQSTDKACRNLTVIAQILNIKGIPLIINLPLPSLKYGKVDLSVGVNKINQCLENEHLGAGVILLDLSKVLTNGEYIYPKYTYDGVHLNAIGYEQWIKKLMPYISSLNKGAHL